MNRREFMQAVLAAGAVLALPMPPDPDDEAEVPAELPPVEDRYLIRVGWVTPVDGVVAVLSGDTRIWGRFTPAGLWTDDDIVASFRPIPKAPGPIRLEGPPGTLAILDLAIDRPRSGGFKSMDDLVRMVEKTRRNESRLLLRVA